MVTYPVSISFTFTRDEYVRAMKRHYRTNLNVGRDVAGGVLALAAGIYLLMSSSGGWLAWIVAIAGGVMLMMIGYIVFLLPSLIYRSQPKLKNEYALTFSDDEIGFKTDNINANLQWSLYQSWLCDDDFYIMYHGKRDLSVIPRRVLSDDDDGRFREMLIEKIGPPTN